MPGPELRRAVRFDVDVSAEIYTADAVLPASTRNLSDSGVCVDIGRPLSEDAEIGVSLFLVADGIEDPDAEPVNLRAKVVWCSERDDTGFSAGMRFESIGEAETGAISTFLKRIGQ
jgi:hypothetical protein